MTPDGFRTPTVLRGRTLELRPLEVSQREELRHAARDPEIRRYLREGPGESMADLDAFIAVLLERQRAGTDLPFTMRLLPDGPCIGMTRYLNIDRPNHNVEVGGTWIDSAHWRTAVNTESKLLMLGHAFEDERVRRVQIQTDARNRRSQAAIERLGAVREAALRENVLLPDGYFRTSIVYSILDAEWPAVKAHLQARLARGGTRPPSG